MSNIINIRPLLFERKVIRELESIEAMVDAAEPIPVVHRNFLRSQRAYGPTPAIRRRADELFARSSAKVVSGFIVDMGGPVA